MPLQLSAMELEKALTVIVSERIRTRNQLRLLFEYTKLWHSLTIPLELKLNIAKELGTTGIISQH